MQALLLLTLDPALEREVELLLEDRILLTVQSVEALHGALGTMQDVSGVLVDTASFPVPDLSAPLVLCVGGEEVPGRPLLERPLRGKELRALLGMTPDLPASASQQSQGVLPSPFAEFLRDSIHDLNNQFTTLQGNLLLLREEKQDPALDDMAEAASRAIQHLQWLEWLGDGDFAAEPFHLPDFLQQLAPILHRLRNRKTLFTIRTGEPVPVPVQADPQKFLSLLLTLVHQIPGHPEACTLEATSSARRSVLFCSWQDPEPPVNIPDACTRWASALGCRIQTAPGQWSLHW